MKNLYEVINPSDFITFEASPDIAAHVAFKLRSGMMYVKDMFAANLLSHARMKNMTLYGKVARRWMN